MGFVVKIWGRAYSSFPRADLSYDLCTGYIKCSVAVEDGDTDLDFGNLFVEVPQHQRLAEKLDAIHLALDATLSMVPALSPSQGTT